MKNEYDNKVNYLTNIIKKLENDLNIYKDK
jgi:hypothetical protein